MRPYDIRCADMKQREFVAASIARFAETGEIRYTYKVTVEEIKKETGRARLRETTIQEYVRYFKETCADAEYKETSEMFTVTIDLGTAALTASQAHLFTEAKSKRGTS